MKYILLISGICIFLNVQAQLPKFTITTDLNKRNSKDSFFIHRISTNQFDSMINGTNNSVIHFYQPWCGSGDYWIDKVQQLKNRLDEKGITYFMIIDTYQENEYFKISSDSLGRVAYNILKYKLTFPMYIIESKKEIDIYKKIISKRFNVKLKDKSFMYLIQQGKLVYQDYSFRFFKKIFKLLETDEKN